MDIAVLGAAVLVALLAGLSCKLPSLSSTLLVSYLALVANAGGVTWFLSPFRAVTQAGLLIAECFLLAGVFAVWWRQGRPTPPLDAARSAFGEVVRDPAAALFLMLAAVFLGYELLLGLGGEPNNWDSLTYHLPRAAAWFHHGGLYWIQNPPSANFNEYPSLAEQQLLFLFAATRSTVFFAMPQYVAELAILVAIYGAARRLGFATRAASCAACLFATFSFVALQATTAQNDLVAASFPIVAACLLLGNGGRIELVFAGAAAAIGLGAKPTTAFALPVLALLVALRGRRAAVFASAGWLLGFITVGCWSYVLNVVHTGSPWGAGFTNITAPGQESLHPGRMATVVDVIYQLLDLAALSDRTIRLMFFAGIAWAVAVALYALRRWLFRRVVFEAATVVLPFASPLLVIRGGDIVAWLARSWSIPVRGHGGNVGGINRSINGCTFGPLGAIGLLGVPLVAVGLYARRRLDARHLAFALALPVFLLLLSEARYNWFLTRFLLVPAALTAPLFALLFRNRAVTLAYVAVAAVVAGLVMTRDPLRPFESQFGHPWHLSQAQAIELTQRPEAGLAFVRYEKLVPHDACVGAVLGGDEPAYLLSGTQLEHPVVYLPVERAIDGAYLHNLAYVVISTGDNRWAAGQFRSRGWRIRPLSTYWLLASAPHPVGGSCTV